MTRKQGASTIYQFPTKSSPKDAMRPRVSITTSKSASIQHTRWESMRYSASQIPDRQVPYINEYSQDAAVCGSGIFLRSIEIIREDVIMCRVRLEASNVVVEGVCKSPVQRDARCHAYLGARAALAALQNAMPTLPLAVEDVQLLTSGGQISVVIQVNINRAKRSVIIPLRSTYTSNVAEAGALGIVQCVAEFFRIDNQTWGTMPCAGNSPTERINRRDSGTCGVTTGRGYV